MSTTVRFRFEPAVDMADRLDRLAQRARIAGAAAEAVNVVSTRASASLQRGEIRDINLTPAYVKSKTDLRLAEPGQKPRATITTSGDLTVLGRFSPLSMIAGRGVMRRAGPRAGLRNAGTNVAIKKSASTFEPQWFVLPLRRGTQAGLNGFGVFVRDDRLKPSPKALREGKAGKRHIYGPSPYQLFKEQVRVQAGDITGDLAQTALSLMGRAIEDELA